MIYWYYSEPDAYHSDVHYNATYTIMEEWSGHPAYYHGKFLLRHWPSISHYEAKILGGKAEDDDDDDRKQEDIHYSEFRQKTGKRAANFACAMPTGASVTSSIVVLYM